MRKVVTLFAPAFAGTPRAHEPHQRARGLVTIAVGTALGFIAVDRQAGQHWYFDPKYIVTLVVLLLYLAYFQLARTTAWRGARASKLCVLILFSWCSALRS